MLHTLVGMWYILIYVKIIHRLPEIQIQLMSWILFSNLTLIIFLDDLWFILELTPLLEEIKQLSGRELLGEVRQ